MRTEEQPPGEGREATFPFPQRSQLDLSPLMIKGTLESDGEEFKGVSRETSGSCQLLTAELLSSRRQGGWPSINTELSTVLHACLHGQAATGPGTTNITLHQHPTTAQHSPCPSTAFSRAALIRGTCRVHLRASLPFLRPGSPNIQVCFQASVSIRGGQHLALQGHALSQVHYQQCQPAARTERHTVSVKMCSLAALALTPKQYSMRRTHTCHLTNGKELTTGSCAQV